MTPGRWDERIARAQKLSATYPFAAEILRFYERVSGAQKQVYARVLAACGDAMVRRPAGTLRGELDLTVLLPELRGFLGVVERHGPAPVAAAARELSDRGSEAWVELLTAWWARPDCADAPSKEESPAVESRFCARAFLEPYAQFLAEHTEPPVIEQTPSVCPLCGARPQLGVLRPQGDGARRSLVCSLCATEWNYGRILCPACGENSETHLAIYIAEELPHVRVEACDICHVYMKTVDLAKNGLAVPVVDEIAGVPLDLWAREKGYTKLQPNLLGM
jgi:formate dehydrogenase accessory protein FdhE